VIDLFDDNGELRRVALTHPDPERLEWIKDFERRYPTDPLGPDTVLTTGRAQVIPEITDEMLIQGARSEEHLADLRSFHLSSIMAVPLKVRDRIIGQIGFLATDSGRHYGTDDLALAEDLARRAATAVDNARLYHEAQRALRLRDEFLSIASHELKTPLTALQLHVQVLERALTSSGDGAPDRRRVERFLAGARRQMHRLARLINDLLDVSRISSGKHDPQCDDIDLGAIVQEVVDRFAVEAEAAGSRLTLNLNGSVHAWADGVQIDQVVTNLLSNAIKYGRGQPIDVCLESDDAVARLVVEDHGMGIAPEHIPLVFERFERVTLSHNYRGLGLGLYIARQIVEAHGGRITIASAVEEGTIFTVELPTNGAS
jgi:signal transduction histidine kinase